MWLATLENEPGTGYTEEEINQNQKQSELIYMKKTRTSRQCRKLEEKLTKDLFVWMDF